MPEAALSNADTPKKPSDHKEPFNHKTHYCSLSDETMIIIIKYADSGTYIHHTHTPHHKWGD